MYDITFCLVPRLFQEVGIAPDSVWFQGAGTIGGYDTHLTGMHSCSLLIVSEFH